ncbi:MAG: prepilin-type N-terminal cleavage/methylation domain-containing protein [Candidatus Dadabacteria bacterium]|nr:MAG: prepilin-type N-terminal cleavage/methylation domain-containing protein [Candidatus Dadabacteria bacterium]
MKQTQCFLPLSRKKYKKASKGFSIIEMMVALTIFSIMGAIVSSTVVLQANVYLTDIGRVRVQQNLRSISDIIAVNIRQAGEGLDEFFPAVELQDGPTLVLRRKLLSEVLFLCQDASAGDVQLYVSDDSSEDVNCIPANIADSLAAWTNYRTEKGGEVSIYIYDRVNKVGEFLTYSGEDTSAGDDYLDVTALSNDYPASSTTIYVLEEYSFSLNNAENTLVLTVNDSTTMDVGYDITDFTVTLLMQDGSELSSLAPGDDKTWKDIKTIKYTLTGQSVWKNYTVTQSLTGEYFPRNVMSG